MNESLSAKKQRASDILAVFDIVYKDADCTLNYSNVLELLIATRLAAQCTDARVNIVTAKLFKKYKNVYDFANADEEELQNAIRSTGFFRSKSKSIIECCRMLIDKFDGEVPHTMEELLSLPGVGRKTANLVLGDFFGIPGVVVDTHASRLSNRMGLTRNTDPYKIEIDLQKIIPADKQSHFCHCLVAHGREFCTARSPKCNICPTNHLCPKNL